MTEKESVKEYKKHKYMENLIPKVTSNCNGTRTHNHLVRKKLQIKSKVYTKSYISKSKVSGKFLSATGA